MVEFFVYQERSAHWYTADGHPQHDVPNLSKPGQFRSTTLTDAKKLALLPSVTGIQGVVKKPALDAWIQTQLVLAALTLPKLSGESLDDFAKRVVRDSSEQSKAASAFGTRIHALVESYLRNKDFSFDITKDELKYLEGFEAWQEEHELGHTALEKTFGTEDEGFGGTIDFVGTLNKIQVIIDWKTQKTKADKPIMFYPEWASQLAAYKYGNGYKDHQLVSVAISSTEPGRVEHKMWPSSEEAWEVFKAKRTLYYSDEGPGHGLTKGKWAMKEGKNA